MKVDNIISTLKTTRQLFFLLSCFFILPYHTLQAQKQGNIWYFGKYAGLSFNNYHPTPLYNSAMFQYEGCATISDASGNLLFYTNGMTVWNRKHQEMANGTGLKGDYQSTQSSVIVPKPLSSNIYYIFTIDNVAGPDGLRYSVVDMTEDNGYGKVITKNIPLITPTTEKVTAVQHANDTFVWVITHGWDTNAFFAYLVTDTGVVTTPVVSNVGMRHSGSQSKASGYLKASPDGSKIAIAMQTYYGKLEILDFNDSTGVVSNPIRITNITDPYGLEFSPDGTKLYVSSQSTGKIYQFNLAAGSPSDIKASKVLIGSSASQVGALQIAIDGRIYVARVAGYLGVIKNPNEYGLRSGYVDKGVYLGGRQSKYGLPTFNQSYFYNPEFTFENLCYGDSTRFYIFNTGFIDSVRWYFGDFMSGSKNTSTSYRPVHKYTAPGSYYVGLFIYHQGTIDTITWTVPIYPKPNAEFTVNDSTQCLYDNHFVFFNNSSIPYGSLSYEWHFGDGDSTFDSFPVYSYSKAGNFNVSLIATSNHGCKDTVSHTITVYPDPVADFEMNDSAQCFDRNQFEFTNTSFIPSGNLFYHWDFGDGDTSNKENPKHVYTAADTFVVRLIATSQKQCRDTVEKKAYVHVHPTPIASFSVDDTSRCFLGNKFTFTNSSYISSGSMTYLWDFGDSKTTTLPHPSHSYDTSGRFEVVLTAISDWNCKDRAKQMIYVNPEPHASFEMNDSSQCLNGNEVKFTNTSTIEFTQMNFLWDFGDGQTSTLAHPSHIFTTDDTFTVKLITTSEFGCKDSAEKSVFIHSMPAVSFGVNDWSQCLTRNRFKFYNLTTINKGSITRYLWDMGDGSQRQDKNPEHVYMTFGDYPVKLVAVSDFGCRDSLIQTVTVNPMPEAGFTINDSDQCLDGNLFIFQQNSSIPEGYIASHIFYTGDGFSSSGSPLSYSYGKSGTYKVTYYAVSDQGCKDSAFKDITVYPMPEADFQVNNPTQCLNENQFLFSNISSISAGTIDSYYWSFGDGASDNNVNTSHKFSSYGQYTVELEAVSNHGCKDSIVKFVSVLPNPEASFRVNRSGMCLDSNLFVFTDESTIPEGVISNYQWNFDDGTQFQGKNAQHIYKTSGTYAVVLKAYSSLGCVDSFVQQVEVYPEPEVHFTFGTPCLESSTQFKDKTLIDPPGKIKSYYWDFGDSNSSIQKNPVHFYSSPGVYHVRLTVSSDKNCKNAFDTALKVSPHPDAPYLIAATVEDDLWVRVDWLPSTRGSIDYYRIESSSDGQAYSLVDKVSSFKHSYKYDKLDVDAETYYFRVRAVDSCSYVSPESNTGKNILLKVSPDTDPPHLFWTSYEGWPEGVDYYEIQLKDLNSGSFNYLGQSDSNTLEFTDDVNNELMDEYCYRVIAFEKDKGTQSVSNVVCNSLPLLVWIPNSFSPNDDGLNDYFEVKGKYIKTLQIAIYNRWGEEVFRSNDIHFRWDGTFKGKKCPPGAYYYHIFVSGTNYQQYEKNGSLLIIR